MSLRINRKSIIIFVLVLLLYASLIPSNPIGGYLDDIVPLFFLVFWLCSLMRKEKSKETIIFYCLVGICLIGLISNVISGISRTLIDIVLDMYSFLKLYFVYLGTKAFFEAKKRITETTIKYIASFAKLFILVGFFFGVLHHLGIISMGELERYGHTAYAFIFGNASQFGILVGVAVGFVILENPKDRKWYTLFGLVTLVMTLKGMALIIVGVYCSLYLLRTKKIKVWHLTIVGAVLVFLLRFQIYGYLLNSSAPRAVLLRYGVITANKFFPFGSGFATYGSDIAAKHYSPLYLQYGFATREVLTYGPESTLNDVYLGMVFGEFGWLGAVLFIYIFYLIWKSIILAKNAENHSFMYTIALFACLSGMAIMAGSIKVAGGQLLVFAIQMFLCLNRNSKMSCLMNQQIIKVEE